MKSIKIITIIKEDLIFFPPAISLLRILSELNYTVVHIGYYSDDNQRHLLESLGVKFCKAPHYRTEGNALSKFVDIIKFKKYVKDVLRRETITSDDYIWVINPANMIPLYSILGKYRTVLQFYEFARPNVTKSYKIYNPFIDLTDICKKADKIVHCDYTRALFFKEMYGLKKVPYVIPNKPNIDESLLLSPPQDIIERVNQIKKMVNGKKVILYQGVFSPKERRLDEFCDAIQQLPDDYVFLAMGRGGEYFEQISKKYKDDDRIILVDFIRPPFHLLVTKMAHIGVLTYFPATTNVASVINVFYCAPNKIFEFAKYGIPMISNNLPGLAYTFQQYNCGMCIEDVTVPTSICDVINNIENNYLSYSDGALNYYNSVDLKDNISNVLES